MNELPRGDRFVEFLFRAWANVYDKPLFQRPFYRRVHAGVERILDGETAPARVLDLGCGTAQLTADLVTRWPEALVIGLDLSDGMLAAARRRLGETAPPFLRGNVYALPFADASLDLVTSTISYHWYLEPERALAEVHRVLRPGGHFVLATLSTRFFRGVVAHARYVREADHRADLGAAGFTVETMERVRPAVRVFRARRD